MNLTKFIYDNLSQFFFCFNYIDTFAKYFEPSIRVPTESSLHGGKTIRTV